MKIKQKKQDKVKYIWYTLAIASIIVFLLILLNAVLDLGLKLREYKIMDIPVFEYLFYLFIVLVLIFGIIRPIVIIVKSPSLAIITVDDQLSHSAIQTYKKVAKNIVKYNNLSYDENILLTSYKNNDELLINLNYVFDKTIRKQLNSLIINNAKIVMISTAICQSSKFDFTTVFAVNLKMIKEMVQKCGFRPSMKNLSKLTVKVFTTALIADGLDNLTLSDVMPKSTMDVIGNVPMLGKVLDGVIDGAANALLTIRIGCVARRYLYSDGNVVTKEEIRKNAYKETLLLMPQVLAATVGFFPKKIVKFFSGTNKNGGDLDGETA